jgi:hypothetical protein
LALAHVAGAEPFSDEEILGARRGFDIESLRLRFTHYDQDGRGYQSQADRPTVFSRGLETVTVEQPQLEIVARQGNLTHRLWVPVDIVTAASPDALDAISTASRTNEAGSFDLSTTWQQTRQTAWNFRANFHLEEPFRSWALGFGGAHSFAEDNAVFSFSVIQVLDWLDRFNIFGTRLGRAYRSTTNFNASITQLLSPTTIAALTYGGTIQGGELGNTWNAVAINDGHLDGELLPTLRHRHAFVARIAQYLPWRGVIKASYRFYVDNWGIYAHTVEAALYQRFGSMFYARINYRFHHQSGADFWAPLFSASAPLRTSDSDLAPFSSQTVGGMIAFEPPRVRRLRGLHFDFGYDRYIRTNDLSANIFTCSTGFLF